MPITYLIVAHLLADFTLQPKKLVQYKYKSILGNLLHVAIFVLLAILLLIPYLEFWQTWAVIGGIALVHFITDAIKIKTSYNSRFYTIPFLIDQFVHLVSLVIGGLILRNLYVEFRLDSLYLNAYVWITVLIAIYLAFVFYIIFIQKKNSASYLNVKLSAFTTAFIIYMLAAFLI
jgi:hypothetical protein